ncbi:MAG: pantetheine-phosphate adenylyltransferase [Candidatus Kariarchaeaceae archaeon]
MTKFNTVGLGGTFDHFHKGHSLFLDISCYYSDQVHVGLISDKYLDNHPKKFRKKIFEYSKRALDVEKYIKYRNKSSTIVKIDSKGKDIEYASESDLEAIIASQETYPGALRINSIRSSMKKDPFTIILIPFVVSEGRKKLNSTQIREQE